VAWRSARTSASLNATYVIKRPSYGEWSAELRVSGLFVDNTEFHHRYTTGDPGEWWLLQGGLKFVAHPEERTHWFGRIGAVVADVNGNADIVDGEGTYYGDTYRLRDAAHPRITMGPTSLPLGRRRRRRSGIVLVPQSGTSYMLAVARVRHPPRARSVRGPVGSVLPGCGE
jgi:hypothetical protein